MRDLADSKHLYDNVWIALAEFHRPIIRPSLEAGPLWEAVRYHLA